MAANHNFSQRPFSMGSLIGLRSFAPKEGSLYGPVYLTPFAPGENMALCNIFDRKLRLRLEAVGEKWSQGQWSGGSTGPAGVRLAAVHFEYGGAARVARRPMPDNAKLAMERALNHFAVPKVHGDGLGEETKTFVLKPPGDAPVYVPPVKISDATEGETLTDEEQDELRRAHVATKDCSCGFYAYFDRAHNTHHTTSNVLGLIEGYGVVTIGSRGFRAQKARLLALVGTPESAQSARDREILAQLIDESVVRPSTVPQAVIDRYGVPVFETLDKALSEYPMTNPNDLLGTDA